MNVENARRILQRDPNPHLFRQLALRSVSARNRIMLSPMCQYSATDGLANDWHYAHLAARAVGGAGIVCVEATHVEPRGRITGHCLGLWNDEQRDALARIAAFVAQQGAVPAIQIGHAGRKASVSRPWEGTLPLKEDAGGWTVIGPSDVPYAQGFPVPLAMDSETIAQVKEAFRMAARRARIAGFKILELHAGHGYLFHQFFAPVSNRRTDEYGGSLDNRARLLLETIDVVRTEWPLELPLFVRISLTDWVPGGWDIGEGLTLCRMLRARGDVDLIDCTSGGNDARQRIEIHPGYQVPLAERVRREVGIATGAVGLIGSPEMAEEVVANGRADLVILGRALLSNPHWPLHAANALKAKNVSWPVQYERSNIF
ncbi:MAG: NADH:flavin oxidoreductase/NADH oxidase [Pseudorhodoplanes sp.]|uniref:NADH:flavin oxidoreductase/NADH oxidase n=1 Tax=Pseudorhodoplanes sp. TaxID=1934341 RepID=UPI003D1195AD